MIRNNLVISLLMGFLMIPVSSAAAWQKVAWDIFSGTVATASGNIISSFVDPNFTEGDVLVLHNKVSNLEEKLQEFNTTGERPENFSEVQQTIVGLRAIVFSLDKRVTTLEEKVKNLENRLLIIRNSWSNVNYTITEKDRKKIFLLTKPSFNCSKVKKDIELSICGNLILRDIDGRMGNIYWELRRHFSDKISKRIRSEQLAWLKKRDAVCYAYDESCLVRLYNERIVELKSKF